MRQVISQPACPGTSIGRVSRQSDIVSSEPRTMSRSLAIRRSKSSASSGERSENHMISVAGAAIDGTQCIPTFLAGGVAE
jgi:hypothetical protein